MMLEELARWGPGCDVSPPSLEEARSYCRHLATAHYENFPVVSWLLPRELHQHFYNVYAYCRWADDLADETGDPARSLSLLAWWRSELEQCLEGKCRHPVFVALRETIEQFRIPPEPFLDLISAFEQDQTVREYESFDQLRDYCRRSADPVGRILLYLLGGVTPQNVVWSDSICTGLQLTNFWQDIRRDFDNGRVYLPRADRLRFGYLDIDLRRRATTPEFLKLMEFQVQRAREWLMSGAPLASRLPGRLGFDIDLFRRGGLAILRQIKRIGYRVWDQRPTLSRWGRMQLIVTTLCRRRGM